MANMPPCAALVVVTQDYFLGKFSTERDPPLQDPSIGHSYDPFCIMSEFDAARKGVEKKARPGRGPACA